MTVARLREEMGNDEFIHWQVYYARLAQQRELSAKGG